MASGIGGGKAAAAADLARARGRRAESDVDADADKIANAQAVFRTADALLNALRTYSRNHPALGRFTEKLESDLRTYFDRDDELTFSLEARDLMIDGVCAHRAERIESNIWFPLFSAGIRELTLAPGLDADEALELFELLVELRDAAAIDQEGEDDAVTMLWQAELEHVSFIAIDSFTHGEADEARLGALREMVETCMLKELTALSLVGKPYAQNEVTRRMRDVALTSADVDVLRAENLSALDELPAGHSVSPEIASLEGAELRAFAAGLIEEPTVVERYVDALLSSLGESDEDAGPVLEQLRELFAAVIEDRRYLRGRRMVDQILAAGAAGGRRGNWRDDLERQVITPATLAAIVDAISGGTEDAVGQLMPLLGALSSWAAATVIGRLPAVDDDRIRAALADLVVGWGDTAQLALRDTLALTDDEGRALELVRLAIRIGGGRLGRSLRAALEHPSAAVRANAFRALARQAAPAEADAAAISALGDRAPVVRRLAIEHVIRSRPPAAARVLARRVEADLGDVELDELRRLYVAHAAVGGEPVAGWLLERLGQRGLLGRARANEERIAAAGALGYLRCAEARPLLTRLSGSRLTRKEVRSACAEALAELDKPEPAPAPAPAPEPEAEAKPAPAAGVDALLGDYLGADETPRPNPKSKPKPKPKPSESLELLLSDYVSDED